MEKKHLTIQEYDPKTETTELSWNYENFYCDLKTNILVKELYVEQDLKPNVIYKFTFEDDLDSDTYHYVVQKKLEANKYLIAEFYADKFYSIRDKNLLGTGWIFVEDFEKEFHVDFDKTRQGIINYYENKQ